MDIKMVFFTVDVPSLLHQLQVRLHKGAKSTILW